MPSFLPKSQVPRPFCLPNSIKQLLIDAMCYYQTINSQTNQSPNSEVPGINCKWSISEEKGGQEKSLEVNMEMCLVVGTVDTSEGGFSSLAID